MNAKNGSVVRHGNYKRESRYDITQRVYAGGPRGYIEVLEIADPPEGYGNVVLYRYCDDASLCFFSEWDSFEDAQDAFRRVLSRFLSGVRNADEREQKMRSLGCTKLVHCGDRIPWFYAVENQPLDGPFVGL